MSETCTSTCRRWLSFVTGGPHDHVEARQDEQPGFVCARGDDGQFAIEVLGGDIYILDLNAHTLTRLTAPFVFRQIYRLPGSGQEPIRGPKMRSDGRALPLRRLACPRLGHRLDMLVDAWEAGEPRRWVTPTVTYLWRLPLASGSTDGGPA